MEQERKIYTFPGTGIVQTPSGIATASGIDLNPPVRYTQQKRKKEPDMSIVAAAYDGKRLSISTDSRRILPDGSVMDDYPKVVKGENMIAGFCGMLQHTSALRTNFDLKTALLQVFERDCTSTYEMGSLLYDMAYPYLSENNRINMVLGLKKDGILQAAVLTLTGEIYSHTILTKRDFVICGELELVPTNLIRSWFLQEPVRKQDLAGLTELAARTAKETMQKYEEAGIIPVSTIGGEIHTVETDCSHE